MAHLHTIGRVHVHSGSGTKRFRIRYVDGLGRKRERTATSEDKALSIARSIDAQMAGPDGALQPGSKFNKVVSEWVSDPEARGWGDKQLDSMRSAARTWVIPELGALRCDQLSSGKFNKLLARIANEGYSESLVLAVRTCLNGACAYGVEKRVWSHSLNPALGIKLPKKVRDNESRVDDPIDPDTIPSDVQVAALVTAAYERRFTFGLLVEVASVTALRFGELAALQVGDWNPTTRKLAVRRALTESSQGRRVGPPKTSAGRREVVVPPTVAEKLTKATTGKARTSLIFTSPKGRMLHHSNLMRREFRPAAASVGLPDRVGMHTLRHFCITTWVDMGITASKVAKAAGHSNPLITTARYYRAKDDYLDVFLAIGT